jgi:hypothetical protein
MESKDDGLLDCVDEDISPEAPAGFVAAVLVLQAAVLFTAALRYCGLL